MRKRFIDAAGVPSDSDAAFLPIASIAQVEVSSETPDAPIEAALSPGAGSGWRAATPGEQRVRILFDHPERVRKITLKFVEFEPRTQEFVLTWSADVGSPAHIIVRQQWTFSPAGSTTESEIYEVNLDHVRVLELMIKPDISNGSSTATLAEWRVFADR